jgi:signal transduction histidine kinase
MFAILAKLRMLLHPIVIFVIAQISWALLMAVWIYWYQSRSTDIEDIISRLGISQTVEGGQLFILVQGCILMGILLVALYAVFVNFRRQVRLNRLQDAILSNVTHELKTPIASIRMYTETMQLRDLTEEERQRFLSRNLLELDRLQTLVERILLSAQLSSHVPRPSHERLNVARIALASWRRMLDRAGDSRRFALDGMDEDNIDHANAQINGNEHELGILFDNILGNAFKYTKPAGYIALKMRLTKERIEFVVTDDGIGIEPTQLNRIFQKFYRAESVARRNVKGSGLGLSVAHAIVKAHNGSLTAASKGLDKGSSFHVSFKRSAVDS